MDFEAGQHGYNLLSPLLGCGTLGRSFHLSVFQLLMLKNEVITALNDDEMSQHL